jgi:hypothetical protein
LWQDHGLVFASAIGTPLDAANVRREFRQITEAAGLGVGWAPRDLRHTFVSLMSADGVPIEEIARLAGHNRIATTELVYRHELRPVITTGARLSAPADHVWMHKTSGLRDPAAAFPCLSSGTMPGTGARPTGPSRSALPSLGATGLIELALAVLTGSVGLLGDAIHNLSDVSTSAVVFLGSGCRGGRPLSVTHTAWSGPRTWPESGLPW